MKNIEHSQWQIKLAIQNVHRSYFSSPWMFLSEDDVKCYLYSELLNYFSGKRKAEVRDYKGSIIKEYNKRLKTVPLHAELSTSYRKNGEFVDLSIFDPSKCCFWIKADKYSIQDASVPVWNWCWGTENAIGIEIKFNKWISKPKRKYSSRYCASRQWNIFIGSLVRDLKKLRKYKRGWLILVDQHSLFKSYKEWREFVEELIRKANYGKLKKTLNAYYLCPVRKKALSFK